VDFFRGIPLLVLILFAFFFGPRLIPGPLAIRLAPDIFQLSLISAALALALHSAAYQAEIFRAGLQSVSRGQVEASHALGMDGWQAMRHVILPQALRLSLPPLGNELAVLIKDTSFLYIVGFAEMFYQAWQLMGSLGREGAPIQWSLAFLTTIAAIYFGLTYVVTRSLRMVEKRVGAPGMGVASL
jgi:polar amino acid transport system permease protein